MKNKILIGVLSILIYSCGSTNKVRTTTQKKDPRKVNKTETVVEKPQAQVKTEVPKKEESLEATSNVTTTATTVYDYINQFKEVAKGNMKDYKIPASITLAQGILESGAGKGRLCLEANNHFGIKCHTGWTGPSITHDDDALQECFRKYSDPADSYRDHSKFLTSRSRYNDLFQLDILDYKGWANGLKKAGYATDPKYPSKLIGIIERYQLFIYDHEVVAPNQVKSKVEETVAEIELLESKNSNKAEVYVVQKGDTLYSLSKRFNTTVENIKEVNNLKDNSLSIGQEIKIK
ncbi:glucosaminidase domain-containing protein [Flavobacterium okayamense]|uniref:Peptidoglycan hydrolase n=1 Tax=Flavobacterium okayamense TaxID=2830782 RepID=A0ABM7S6P5_9FLAO|nr:glucosaminidase domain-containing protein [Flavobacterium okayamense]BCY28418.1 hemagglutinin [Flavobacterium okayamense]